MINASTSLIHAWRESGRNGVEDRPNLEESVTGGNFGVCDPRVKHQCRNIGHAEAVQQTRQRLPTGGQC
jgi:hypothetical protein